MTAFSNYLRKTVRAKLEGQNLTHREAAKRAGISRPQVSRMLGGGTELLPRNWARLLAALRLELRLVPAQHEDNRP